MCMLAAVMAASNLTAQDTLTLRSYRVVDVCSSERRWLIAPTLGTIRSLDSLMSFDITIGYDTAVTRPTDVLTEGTLSANLDYKPTMSTVVPGEMRIAGFNILTPMIGDKPLVAIAGEFRGTCTTLDSMSFTWPASFNEEFKKVVTIYSTEPIIAVANARTRNDVGMDVENDSVTIEGRDSVKTVVSQIQMGGLQNVEASATFRILDTNVVHIANLKLTSAELQRIEMVDAGNVIVHFKQEGSSSPVVEMEVRSTSNLEIAQTVIQTSLEINDTCGCVRPGKVDSIKVISTNPMVYVSSSADENTADLVVNDQYIRCQCYHGQTNAINVYSIDGALVSSTGGPSKSETFLSIEGLPHGAYVIVGHCGLKKSVILKMK